MIVVKCNKPSQESENKMLQTLKILDTYIERQSPDQKFCGAIDILLDEKIISLLWTLDASRARLDVNFVQGNHSDWDELIQPVLQRLTDNLILAVARKLGRLPALDTPGHPAFAFSR